MVLRLFLLFTLVPIVELALLVWIAQHTSFWFTVALVLLTGVTGAWLARRQGLRCWWDIQTQLGRGELPAARLFDAVLILLAGTLLITPGVLTDCVGLLLLLPPFRAGIRLWLMHRLQLRVHHWTAAPPGEEPPRRDPDQIIDVQAVDPPEEK